MGEDLIFLPPFGVVFLCLKEGEMKRERKSDTQYKEEFEPDPLMEPLRDDDGDVVEGCYRSIPAPDSDNL